METKTSVQLTREEKIALIKAYEVLLELKEHALKNDMLGLVCNVVHDLSLIMDSLEGIEYNVNWFQLDE